MTENLNNILHLWFTGTYFNQVADYLYNILLYRTSPPPEPEDILSTIISFNRSIINSSIMAKISDDVVGLLTQLSLSEYLLLILFFIILSFSLYINYCVGNSRSSGSGNKNVGIITTKTEIDQLLTDVVANAGTDMEEETTEPEDPGISDIEEDPGISDIDILHPDMNDADSDRDE